MRAIEGEAAVVTSTQVAFTVPGALHVSAAMCTGAFAPGRRAR